MTPPLLSAVATFAGLVLIRGMLVAALVAGPDELGAQGSDWIFRSRRAMIHPLRRR